MNHFCVWGHDFRLSTFERFPLSLPFSLEIFFFILNFVGRGNWVCAQIYVRETVHITNIFMPIKSAALPAKCIQENRMLA